MSFQTLIAADRRDDIPAMLDHIGAANVSRPSNRWPVEGDSSRPASIRLAPVWMGRESPRGHGDVRETGRRRRSTAGAGRRGAKIIGMIKLAVLLLSLAVMACAADLPSKKYLNLAALKKMVATAEAEMQKRNVQVTICIVDESGNLLFLQKAEARASTPFSSRRRRRATRRSTGDPRRSRPTLKEGNLAVLAFPDGFPNQGGLPIKVDGKTIGAIACSGAASEVDEAISQAAIDALLKN